jgi:hypothetical protein
MFYHIRFGVTDVFSWPDTNKTREDVLSQILCPFINREITILGNELFNMSSFFSVTIFQSEKPVDSDWPVKKQDYMDKEGKPKEWDYQDAVLKAIEKDSEDVTQELYREALLLIETGKYKELREKIKESIKGKYSFFICPFDDNEVNHNYEFVIKPAIRQFQFDIQKADEISHTREITEVILSAISRSRFIVADLTDARPNCYYEVGYAHSLGKPVIILAKEGTERHFDISGYKWNHWSNYEDLKPKFEKELLAVLRDLGIKTQGNSS